jgi:antitoxin component YwqK of YwqJK toxin-antitoxin module
LLALLALAAPSAWAQPADSLSLEESLAPSISLNPSQQAEQAKKQGKKAKEPKTPKGVFYGIGAKKVVIKTVKGKNVTIEKFYVLRQYRDPSVYPAEKYYFDTRATGKERRIVAHARASTEHGMPLHGPYEKRVNGEVREKGIYYVGSKHGRWVRYGDNFQLLDKDKFVKGFPKSATVIYYDAQKTKIQEVIPFDQGEERHGTYMAFYPNGRLREIGEYERGVRVGQWQEFFDSHLKLRQRITQYPKDADTPGEPYVYKEWNSSGKVIVDNSNR